MARPVTADDVVTAITQASTAEDALGVLAGVGGAALEAVADLLFVDTAGHGAPWVRRACAAEARA
jgi:hypothetical protein